MAHSKKVTEQIDAILKALRLMEGRATIEEIKALSGLDIEIRALQRRLAELKKLGFVKTSEDRRSTRYHYAMPRVVRSGADVENTIPPDAGLLPLSTVHSWNATGPTLTAI